MKVFLVLCKYRDEKCRLKAFWLDWNDDFEFEPGGDEEFELAGDAQGALFTASLVVPEDAPLGEYRMRIRMAYGSNVEPCGNTVYGEVEDYSIMVVAPTFGNLSGIVTAEGGGAIAGATVSVAGETTTTAADGSYSLTDVFTGTHSVSCEASGYTTEIEAHYSSTGAEDYQVSVDVEMVEEYPSLSNELVLQVVLEMEPTSNQIQLNTSNLNKGLCFIQLETENGISSKRVVIE